METFLMYFLFAVGIVLIVKGGDWFVDGAVWIAEVTKIPKFIIGATIISVATTLPEIIVSTIAAVEGHGILVSGVGDYIAASQDKVGMAIGNGIGSVICNTAMILAISVIFMPIAVKRKDFAPKSILLIAAVVALFLFSMSGSCFCRNESSVRKNKGLCSESDTADSRHCRSVSLFDERFLLPIRCACADIDFCFIHRRKYPLCQK